MDRQLYFGSMLNSVESGNMVDYFLSPESANMSVANAPNPTSGNFNGWNFDHAGSSGHATNPISQDAVKTDEWALSTDSNTDASLRLHESFETANMNSDENMDINIDCNQSISMHESDLTLTSEHGAGLVNNNGQVSEVRNFLDTGGFEQISSGSVPSCSTNIPGTSGDINNVPEDPDVIRLGGSLDGRRLSGKRKNIEGASGQSSTSGNPICFPQGENSFSQSVRENLGSSLNISPSNSASGLSVPIPVASPNPRLGITLTVPYDSGPSVNLAGHAENTHRNFRMRINPAHQPDFSSFLWPQGSSIPHNNIVPPNQPSLHTYNHSPDVHPATSNTSSQTYSNIQYIPSLPQSSNHFTRNGAFRAGGSSNVSLAGERFAALRDEAYPRTFVRGTQEPPVFVPPTAPRILGHDPTNWNLSSGDINTLGNVASSSRVSSSTAVYPSAPLTWTPHQNLSNQYPIRLSEFARRSFSSNGSSRIQSNMQHPDRTNSLQDSAPNSSVGNRSQHLQHLRSALLMERQNDAASGVPFSMRLSGRSRIISEICNALEFIRRGDPRIEDVLFLEQSMLLGAADLHDRHRDMRLDVDNMSYEELLALEERIGNVSTGLSEETVMKLLKQRMYSCNVSMENSQDTEPCCVCQEEYVEGEDVGSLDCGHDFHTACIKEWLKHKNICPICKTTALAT